MNLTLEFDALEDGTATIEVDGVRIAYVRPVSNGVVIITVQGIQAALRHSSPSVTVKCYLDRSPRRAVEAVEGLEL